MGTFLDTFNYGEWCVSKYGSSSLADNVQISRNGQRSMWVDGRDKAMIRSVTQPSNDIYCPFLSMKTFNGSWELGPYQNDILHLSFISDTDYNSGTNNQIADYQFTKDGRVDLYSVRNIAAGTGDMTSGSTPLKTGKVYYVYE